MGASVSVGGSGSAPERGPAIKGVAAEEAGPEVLVSGDAVAGGEDAAAVAAVETHAVAPPESDAAENAPVPEPVAEPRPPVAVAAAEAASAGAVVEEKTVAVAVAESGAARNEAVAEPAAGPAPPVPVAAAAAARASSVAAMLAVEDRLLAAHLAHFGEAVDAARDADPAAWLAPATAWMERVARTAQTQLDGWSPQSESFFGHLEPFFARAARRTLKPVRGRV